MKAEDRLLTENELSIFGADIARAALLNKAELKLNIDNVLKAQDAKSFKAGIKEVVDDVIFQKFLWFADNVKCVSELLGEVNGECECATCLAKKMQAKLKEWGI